MSSAIEFRGKNESGWHYGLLTFMFRQYAISHVEYENTVDLIDEKTIGQYTGIKDKYGNKVYEGDVLEYTQKSVNYAGTHSASYCEVYRKANGAYRIRGNHIYDNELLSLRGNLTVVGNIHEHKDLLEQDYRMFENGKQIR